MNIDESIIENKAFWSRREIKHVSISGRIEHIGDWAFAKCVNLETIELACDFRPGLFGYGRRDSHVPGTLCKQAFI